MSSGSRKRKVEHNLGQKFSVLTEIHKGRTQSEIAVEFGIDRCSVSRIKRDEQKILAAIENNENTSKKRDRKTSGEQVEEALFLWFTQMRARNVPLHGPMVLEKAHQISVQINSDFVPNPSWLERFKKRRNIIFHKLHGEKTSDIPENSQVQEVEETFDSPEEMNQEYFQNFVDADAAVPSSGDLTDNEICQEVQDQVEIVDEDDSDHDVAPMPMLSAAEALDMLEKLRVYFSGDVISQEKLDYLENSVETKRKRKQAKISDFFSA